MMSVTSDQLYEAIQHVGPAVAAKLGYFHDLPGGGTGGSSALMVQAHVVQDGNSPQGVGILEYHYDDSRIYPSFVDVLVLDRTPPGPNALDYDISILINLSNVFVVRITTKWNDPFREDDVPPFDQLIGLRIDEFKPTVMMVNGLVV